MAYIAPPIREQLRSFIRSVRAVESGKAASVRWNDGTICTSDEEFGGWFIFDPTSFPKCGHIFLNVDFREGDVTPAVLTILHELAHAYEHMEDNWRAENRPEECSEAAAWFQTAAWAARDTSSFGESLIIATMAFEFARKEIIKWRSRERLGKIFKEAAREMMSVASESDGHI